MIETKNEAATTFYKTAEHLFNSLQKHIVIFSEAEKEFNNSVSFTAEYPFNPSLVEVDDLKLYELYREKFRVCFIDEVTYLDTLIKAILAKKYSEPNKRYLFLLLLGHINIIEAIFASYSLRQPSNNKNDEELNLTLRKLIQLRKLLQLHIQGFYMK